MIRFIKFLIIVFAVTISVSAQMASAQALLHDEFTSLDTNVWGVAKNVPLYLGLPQSTIPTTLDGRSVLQIRSDMYNLQRRGYGTIQAFGLMTAHIEVDFKTIGGIDGLLEVWLTDPNTGKYVAIGVFGGQYGTRRSVFAWSSLAGDQWSGDAQQWWEYGMWYRYVIDAGDSETQVSLRDANNAEIWGHTFKFGLRDMGTRFHVSLVQFMGLPYRWSYGEAAIDRITLQGIIEVGIDVKPGSFPNSINPKSKGKIPVAILTTDTFDAANVDASTVLFGRTGTEASPVHSALEDVDGDGDMDMILHFNTQDTGIVCGDISASLTGGTLSGQAIEGSDSINTVGCK